MKAYTNPLALPKRKMHWYEKCPTLKKLKDRSESGWFTIQTIEDLWNSDLYWKYIDRCCANCLVKVGFK